MAPAAVSAKEVLQTLIGGTIQTATGNPNKVLAIEGDDVIVGTRKSPEGRPVPIHEIQSAIDKLISTGEVGIRPSVIGYRSAFIGAVLGTLPNVEIKLHPARAVLVRTTP